MHIEIDCKCVCLVASFSFLANSIGSRIIIKFSSESACVKCVIVCVFQFSLLLLLGGSESIVNVVQQLIIFVII